MGVSKSTISNWYARNSIDYDILFTRCTDANLNWLITGEQNPVNESVKNEDITETDSLPFTENPSDDFIERKHFSGYFALYEYLARKSSYSEIKKQYEDIISDLYFAYHYTSYYDSSERFNNEYIKFKKGELSKKDLLTSFNEIVEKNKKLFTILEPYVDILHELYQKLDKFKGRMTICFRKFLLQILINKDSYIHNMCSCKKTNMNTCCEYTYEPTTSICPPNNLKSIIKFN